MFFSPEAVAMRQDPEVAEIQEIAALDHFMKGWKNLAPRYGNKETTITNPATGEVIRQGGNELPGFQLDVDDAVDIDQLERVRQEIAETKRFMQEGEVPDEFSSLEPAEVEYLRNAVRKHISGGAIDKIGELGTKNRTYSKKDPIEERRGKVIPAVFKKGEKRERGENLIVNALQNVDVDTGVGTYGNSIDALHREAAANAPHLVTDKGNIRIGNSSLNQSVKEFTGNELDNALQSRLLRLNDEEFFLEHGIPAKQRGGVDSVTRAENAYQTQLERGLDDIIADVRGNKRYAGDIFVKESGPGNVIISV